MDAPAQQYSALRKFLPKALQPLFRGIRKRFTRPSHLAEPFHTVYPYTQVHPVRQENILKLARTIDETVVEGAMVECGVLDGGTAALMAYGTKGTNRPIHLFDSWEGLPENSGNDGDASIWAGEVVGSLRRVVKIMQRLEIEPDRLHFHKGWFEHTFPRACISAIALLHIDCDFYESVKLTLETWSPKVTSGGFIQIDDYETFIGCTRATDEFLAANPHLKLERIGGAGAKAFVIRMP